MIKQFHDETQISLSKPRRPFLQFTEQDIINIALGIGLKTPAYFNRKQFQFAVCHRYSINLVGYGISVNPRFSAKPTKRQVRAELRKARKNRARLLSKFRGHLV